MNTVRDGLPIDEWQLPSLRSKRIKMTYEIRLHSMLGGESHHFVQCLLGDIHSHQRMVRNLSLVKSVCLNPLSRSNRTQENDGECETDGLGSHLVLLSTASIKEVCSSQPAKASWWALQRRNWNRVQYDGSMAADLLQKRKNLFHPFIGQKRPRHYSSPHVSAPMTCCYAASITNSDSNINKPLASIGPFVPWWVFCLFCSS